MDKPLFETEIVATKDIRDIGHTRISKYGGLLVDIKNLRPGKSLVLHYRSSTEKLASKAPMSIRAICRRHGIDVKKYGFHAPNSGNPLRVIVECKS